jgi:hypothetical protein
MTDYKGIKGDRVEYIASDPTLTSAEEGQVWYNSTSGTLKSLVQLKRGLQLQTYLQLDDF